MSLIRTLINDCENCYKCIRNCPVKAIQFANQQAKIIDEDCIYCGQCYTHCPQDAKVVESDVDFIKTWLLDDQKVIITLAPSFLSDFYKSDFSAMKNAFIKLGFHDVFQTAEAATLVKKRYEEDILNKKSKVIISSCCPTINLLIQKYYPKLLTHLSDVPTPMHMHAKALKKEHQNAKVVFVGPCISKKHEASIYNSADAVLSFKEVKEWFESSNIPYQSRSTESHRGRTNLFPVSGGIIRSFTEFSDKYNYLHVDGLSDAIQALNDLEEGVIDPCFIEMSACKGSCTGGPLRTQDFKKPIKSYININHNKTIEDFDFTQEYVDCTERILYDTLSVQKRPPSEEEIQKVFEKMGKKDQTNLLNCGGCGYETCKEKAIAVIEGKADYTMCLPYLKSKAESFSDNIINNSPNGVIVLNESLQIQSLNLSAKKVFEIHSSLVGEHVVSILDPDFYFNILESKRHLSHRQVYYSELEKYFDETVVYDIEHRILISIIRDITQDILAQKQKDETYKKTMEITDHVIQKQMRVVHEIASLLGETTAETKVALNNLRKVLSDE